VCDWRRPGSPRSLTCFKFRFVSSPLNVHKFPCIEVTPNSSQSYNPVPIEAVSAARRYAAGGSSRTPGVLVRNAITWSSQMRASALVCCAVAQDPGCTFKGHSSYGGDNRGQCAPQERFYSEQCSGGIIRNACLVDNYCASVTRGRTNLTGVVAGLSALVPHEPDYSDDYQHNDHTYDPDCTQTVLPFAHPSTSALI
jgi:hypothetical protein